MIYTPRGCIDALFHPMTRDLKNKQVCTKIEFKGYEISIAMDSSHGADDLFRSDIRVYTAPGAVPGVEVTSKFLVEDETMLYGNAETLFRVMQKIEAMSA
jgi:hypothetical protein